MSREVQIRVLVTDSEAGQDRLRGVTINVPDAPDGDAATAFAVLEYARVLRGGEEGAALMTEEGLRSLVDAALARRVRLMRVALAGAPAALAAVEEQFGRLADDVGIKDFRA